MSILSRLLAWRRAYLRTPREWAIDLCTEFAARFPNRCLVCSYHEYGQREGHTTEPTPLHACHP